MQRWQQVSILAVVAWMLAVGSWANRSWTETVPLATPAGAEGQSRSYQCGAPFGPRSVDRQGPPTELAPVREPCDLHGERRALAVVDLALGAAAIAALAYLGARSTARRAPETVG